MSDLRVAIITWHVMHLYVCCLGGMSSICCAASLCQNIKNIETVLLIEWINKNSLLYVLRCPGGGEQQNDSTHQGRSCTVFLSNWSLDKACSCTLWQTIDCLSRTFMKVLVLMISFQVCEFLNVFKCRAELRSGIGLLQTVVETKILNGFKGVDG